MPQCVVIADDLTGANATGVLLKSQISYRVASQNPAIIQPSKVTQHDT